MKSDRFSLTPRTKTVIMAFDAVLLALTVSIVYWLRFKTTAADILFTFEFWTIALLLLSSLYIFGDYDLDKDDSFVPLAYRTFVSVFSTFLATVLLNYLVHTDRAGLFGRGVLLGSLVLYFICSVVLRFFLWRYLTKIRSRVKILIFSTTKHKDFLENEFKKNKFPGEWSWILQDGEVGKNSWKDLEEISKQGWTAWVLAASLDDIEQELGQTMLQARFSGIRITDLSSFYEHTWKKIPVFHLAASWFFLNEGFRLIANRFGLRVKRLNDILLSAFLLLITWPFMLLTAMAVKLESPGDVIYKQIRTGKDGKDFKIYKFRSMRSDAEKSGAQWASQNDARVTRVGKFIRLTRLDELPQLWNVLKGDMSFIGPRPERPEFNKELSQTIPYYELRHLVRPGITGWAQVLYPYGASTEDSREKLQYDLFYIKNFSYLLDIQIVLKTISVVLLGKGR
jgi:sugar transferase (PEP-CTERM system associated)